MCQSVTSRSGRCYGRGVRLFYRYSWTQDELAAKEGPRLLARAFLPYAQLQPSRLHPPARDLLLINLRRFLGLLARNYRTQISV
jgi:hypothetical protein